MPGIELSQSLLQANISQDGPHRAVDGERPLLPKAGVSVGVNASAAGAQDDDDQRGTPRNLFEPTGENPAARDLPDELPHIDEKGEGKIGSNLGYGGVTFRGQFSTPKGVGYRVG